MIKSGSPATEQFFWGENDLNLKPWTRVAGPSHVGGWEKRNEGKNRTKEKEKSMGCKQMAL